MNGVSEDRFLDGKVIAKQPVAGYRAGVDAVLLAAAVPAGPGERVLELGLGVGVAILCLAARVPDLRLAGVEVQPDYADLARQNAKANGAQLDVHVADIRQLPDLLRSESFDQVIANPPYFKRSDGSASPEAGREAAMGEDAPLEAWIDIATRRLGPKGRLTLILDAARLPDLLRALDPRLGEVTILPLAPRIGRQAHRVILRARKGSKAGFSLLAPLILHEGSAHDRDAESYTPEIAAVLRDGAALPFD